MGRIVGLVEEPKKVEEKPINKEEVKEEVEEKDFKKKNK